MVEKKVKDILKKYEERLRKNVDLDEYQPTVRTSREYETFRKEALPKRATIYENLCNSAENILKVKPTQKDFIFLQNSIETAHINITPAGAASFSTLTGLGIVLLAILISLASFLVTGEISMNYLFLSLLLVVGGLVVIKPLNRIPYYLANSWRLKASNQMVLCILYTVMYMRHTSNLEHALRFASEHIGPPLSLDLRKVIWDVETRRYSTVKESLDNYLANWRQYNSEFVESFNLIQGSLYEPSEDRRTALLDKALDVMLDGTYEKMLHYAHDLKNPITMLHMLGIVLPILGLVIFPLIGSFMGGMIKWYHIAFIYNIILPISIFYIGTNILSKRPTGYGESEYSKFSLSKKSTALTTGIIIAFVVCMIGLSPLILHVINPSPAVDPDLGSLGKFLDFKDGNGPYGVGALFFSFAVPLGLALGISTYYKLKTNKIIKIRNETKKLEKEFSGALFQLGNRIGDGIPAELAFERVASNMKGTVSGSFFGLVSMNIKRFGMGLKEAIFNRKNGAILSFPSAVIESSMKILIESARKGSKIVSKSLISISDYINRIHKVNERLKDLLADVISSMKGQINFMTPMIAGIVVGIASMVTSIIGKLGEQFTAFASQGVENVPVNLASIVNIFSIKDVIPPFYFQIVAGIYVVQVIILLTILANGIENGSDKLNEQYLIGKNVLLGTGLYLVVAIITTLIFTLLATGIMTATSNI